MVQNVKKARSFLSGKKFTYNTQIEKVIMKNKVIREKSRCLIGITRNQLFKNNTKKLILNHLEFVTSYKIC